ncbi:MAG: cyclase family protein [Chloroflexi bacterium]|nr:cyclase family protein [Chloroflexota bacterium]
MKIYDISLPISPNIVVWEDDPHVTLTQVSHLDRGDIATLSTISCSVHTGTHVDAPCHFIAGGASVESLDLYTLVGPAWVADAEGIPLITAAFLDTLDLPPHLERLLLRSDNSKRQLLNDTSFHRDYVALAADAASWLVEKGIKLVGVDYLSVAPFQQIEATHHILLGAGVVVVEGLNLQNIEPGLYQFYCLPLRIVGSDGAPARAILIAS